MNKKISAILQAVLALAAAALIPVLACGPSSGGKGPTVVIISPADGSTVVVGQQVLVQSSASDEGGVARVELLVNSVVVRADSPAEGTPTTFAIAQPWTPKSPGDVVVHIVAYNTENQASLPTSITLHVVESAAQVTPISGPTQTPVPDVTEESGCTLNGSYVADLTVPDNTVLQPGVAFTKSWRIRNSGTCDWGTGFKLVFVGDSQLGGPASVAIPATLSGSAVDVALQMVAPSEPGTYKSRWRMQSDQGQVFGSTVYVLIVVPEPITSTPTLEPAPAITPSPTVITATVQPHPDLEIADVAPESISVEVGEWFEIQVAVRNGGIAPADSSTLEGVFPPDGVTETVDIPALDPGEVHIATLRYRIAEPAYGEATIRVGPEDAVDEVNEGSSEVTVQVAVDPPSLTVGELVLGEGDSVDLDHLGAYDFGWNDDGGGYALRPQADAVAYIVIMEDVSDRAHYAQIDPTRFSADDIPALDLAVGAVIAVRTDTGHRGFLRVEALDARDCILSIFWEIWDWP